MTSVLVYSLFILYAQEAKKKQNVHSILVGLGLTNFKLKTQTLKNKGLVFYVRLLLN